MYTIQELEEAENLTKEGLIQTLDGLVGFGFGLLTDGGYLENLDRAIKILGLVHNIILGLGLTKSDLLYLKYCLISVQIKERKDWLIRLLNSEDMCIKFLNY